MKYVIEWNKGSDFQPFTVRIGSTTLEPRTLDEAFWNMTSSPVEAVSTSPHVSPGGVVGIAFKDQVQPVIAVSYPSGFSQGYFVMNVVLTIPIPSYFTDTLGNGPVSLRVFFGTDGGFPAGAYDPGKYTAPEGFNIVFNGFRKVKDILKPVFVSIGGEWAGNLALDAVTAASSKFPVPHVVISWNVECIGPVSGSVAKVDYDVLMSYSIGAFSHFSKWTSDE